MKILIPRWATSIRDPRRRLRLSTWAPTHSARITSSNNSHRKRSRFHQMRRYAEAISKKLPKKMKPDDPANSATHKDNRREQLVGTSRQLQEMDERTDDLTMDLKDPNIVQPHVGDQVTRWSTRFEVPLITLGKLQDTLSSYDMATPTWSPTNAVYSTRIALAQNEVISSWVSLNHLSDVLALVLKA